MTHTENLTFGVVDGLGFAAANGMLKEQEHTVAYIPRSLGPLFELLHLCASGQFPSSASWSLEADGAAPMLAAIRQKREIWLSSDNRRTGFIRALRTGPDSEQRLTGFLMHAKRAATEVAGLADTTAGQLAAAMGELESNIHEHSESPETGILAYRAAQEIFEFVASDRGIGVLRSLQLSPKFVDLPDHGKALEAAVSDGTSRFGPNSRRGHGFRPIFLGLMNLYGSLRFRSGDYGLLMDGTSPQLATAQLGQKPFMDGFLASVRCQKKPAAQERT